MMNDKVKQVQDERGVTAVLGAMLIFLIIATMWGIIQAYHVPIWNEDVEYQHMDDVYNDLVTLKSDIEDVAMLQTPKSADLRMGVRYPERIFLANPGAGVSGSLTSDDVAVSIEYTLDGLGDPVITQDYVSNRITYEASGGIDSPGLVYEHGLLIRDYGNGEYATQDEQSLFVDGQIFLPLLLGTLTAPSSMETVPVALKPLEGINVRSNIKSVKITLDTNYPEVWQQQLSGLGGGGTGPVTVEGSATDDFESGGWVGGSGWVANWYPSGDTSMQTSGSPHSGSYHVRMRRSGGYLQRAVDLSTATSASLQFWAKADSFEPGDQAYCYVIDGNGTWQQLYTWSDGEDDDTYRLYEFDLSGYTFSDMFWIAFQSGMSSSSDYFYVDDVTVNYSHTEGGTAGDDITVVGNQIIIESSSIKQLELPAGEMTTDALYAGMAVGRTSAEASNYSSIDTSQDYPAALDIGITVGSDDRAQSTITMTVRNVTAPYEIHANLTDLTNDPATADVFPDYASPDSIGDASWDVPNENTVRWTDISHPEYDVGDAFIVYFWVTNSENNMKFVTYKIFQRQSQTAWY